MEETVVVNGRQLGETLVCTIERARVYETCIYPIAIAIVQLDIPQQQ